MRLVAAGGVDCPLRQCGLIPLRHQDGDGNQQYGAQISVYQNAYMSKFIAGSLKRFPLTPALSQIMGDRISQAKSSM